MEAGAQAQWGWVEMGLFASVRKSSPIRCGGWVDRRKMPLKA